MSPSAYARGPGRCQARDARFRTFGRVSAFFMNRRADAENLPAEPLEVGVREFVPAPTGSRRQGLGVADQGRAPLDLLRKLPQVGELFHLVPRQVRADPELSPPAVMELFFGPAAEAPAEEAFLGGSPAHRPVAAQRAERRPETRDRFGARQDLGRWAVIR